MHAAAFAAIARECCFLTTGATLTFTGGSRRRASLPVLQACIHACIYPHLALLWRKGDYAPSTMMGNGAVTVLCPVGVPLAWLCCPKALIMCAPGSRFGFMPVAACKSRLGGDALVRSAAKLTPLLPLLISLCMFPVLPKQQCCCGLHM